MDDKERDAILLEIKAKVDKLYEPIARRERADELFFKTQEAMARQALERLRQQKSEPQKKSTWQALRQRLGL